MLHTIACDSQNLVNSLWDPLSVYRTTEIQIYTNKNYTGRLTVLGDSLNSTIVLDENLTKLLDVSSTFSTRFQFK